MNSEEESKQVMKKRLRGEVTMKQVWGPGNELLFLEWFRPAPELRKAFGCKRRYVWGKLAAGGAMQLEESVVLSALIYPAPSSAYSVS